MIELEVYKKSDFYEDNISSQKEYYECENADAYFAERLAEKDKEIAELKAKLDKKESWVKMLGEGEAALSLELEKTKQKLHDAEMMADATVEKLKAENAELKQKLESVQASMYCDVVDANMENRKLKRALWLARAERAKEMCRRLLIQGFDPKWENVERKCRAKAEEYK